MTTNAYSTFDTSTGGTAGAGDATTGTGGDALSRYRYLLRTASPEDIESAHEQAFSRMTAEERREVLTALSRTDEAPQDATPSALARSATRLEMARPGALQRVLGGTGGNVAGSGLASNLLASLAAGAVGSMAWGTLTGNDGVGGRPGLLSRVFGGRDLGSALGSWTRGGLGGQHFGGERGGFGVGPAGGFGGGFGGGPGGGFGGGRGGFGGGPGGGPGGW